jgi:hypothetical protein
MLELHTKIRSRDNDYDRAVFRERPYFGVLLFDNVSSDARDHAANERSALYPMISQTWLIRCEAFLSWLKLSVYMAIVSVAIVLSFHLKSKPSNLGTYLLVRSKMSS